MPVLENIGIFSNIAEIKKFKKMDDFAEK